MEEVPLFNEQVDIPGVKFYLVNQDTFVVASENMLKVLGSSVLGGDLRLARYIINHSVDKDYNGDSPENDLKQVADSIKIGPGVLGMMTSVQVTHTVLSHGSSRELTVATLCTAGIGNPGVAGLPVEGTPGRYLPGTINLIILIDGNLTYPAMVNSVITATEAKTRALVKANVTLSCGEQVTGTTTDSVVVACTGRGKPLNYAGTATEVGYLIGRTVYEAVWQGISIYLTVSKDLYRFNIKRTYSN